MSLRPLGFCGFLSLSVLAVVSLVHLGHHDHARAEEGLERRVGATVGSVYAGMQTLDLVSAERELRALPESTPGRGLLEAALHFYRGDYDAGLSALPRPGDSPKELEEALGWLFTRLPAAARATDGMVSEAQGNFVYRYMPGPDAVLAQFSPPALEGERAYLRDLLGVEPEQPTVVEFFPDEASFVAASGLPPEWVRTTGTVALCKWDRILIISPRNMPRGYAWLDTLAHEYVHLALARASRNRAPVWIHEGAAKLLESAWRDPRRVDFLDPYAESLLARALAEDKLVPFADMHPSMAALPSSSLAALAFAQVAWAVNFIFERGGDSGFAEVVRRMAAGEDSLLASATELGLALGAGGFESAYKKELAGKDLRIRSQVAHIPLELDGSDADRADEEGMAFDPILRSQREMSGHARIGDLLRRRGRPDAAQIEYERAVAAGTYRSPSLAGKMARTAVQLERPADAASLLRESLSLYPEFAPNLALGADLAAKSGDWNSAMDYAQRAVAQNPFDPEPHRLLLRAYERVGRTDEAERHRVALSLLGIR